MVEEEPIVLLPHQYTAFQESLRRGRLDEVSEQMMLFDHGDGPVERAKESIARVINNPRTPIIFDLAKGTICGDDCETRLYHGCGTQERMMKEKLKARNLSLLLDGKPRVATELFYIPTGKSG